MQRTTSQENLLQEVIDACWRCGGHGGELYGDEWLPCPVCRGGEFAVPQWFRRWRARIHSSSMELEKWMQQALPESLRIWSNPARCAVGYPDFARLMGIDGNEEIFTSLHRCSCQIFELAEVCIHQVAHEWVRRSLKDHDCVEILQQGVLPSFLLSAEKPVWGYRLGLEWGKRGWLAVAHAPDGKIYKFPCIQRLVENFIKNIGGIE